MAESYECSDFKDIAKCFEKLHIHINYEVEKLKVKQTETEKRVDILENQLELIHSELQNIHNKCFPDIEGRIEKEETERMKLELWGRKWNVIVRGVDGGNRENPRETRTRVRQFFIDQLGYAQDRANCIHMSAVHRLPSGPIHKRNVICRITSLIDRDELLHAAATTLRKGSGFSVVPDLPPSLAILRGNLLKERSEMSSDDRSNCRLMYLREPPFVKLVMKPKSAESA